MTGLQTDSKGGRIGPKPGRCIAALVDSETGLNVSSFPARKHA